MTSPDEQRRAQIRAVAEQRAKRRAEARPQAQQQDPQLAARVDKAHALHCQVIAALLARIEAFSAQHPNHRAAATLRAEITGDELDATDGALHFARHPERDALVVTFTPVSALPQLDEGEEASDP